MRKTVAFILSMLLMISTLGTALASAGDMTISAGEESYSVCAAAFAEDNVYIATYDGMFIWNGDTELCRLAEGSVEQIAAECFEGVDSYVSSLGLFCNDNKLCALVAVTTYDDNDIGVTIDEVYMVQLFSGEERIESEPVRLDWDMFMESYEEYSYPVYPNNIMAIGDTLYMSIDIGGKCGLYGVPLDGGYAYELDESLDNIIYMTSFKEGELLLLEYEYAENSDALLMAYDTIGGTVSQLCEIEIENYSVPQGIAYNEQNDMIYYCAKGSIMQFDYKTGETTSVNELAMNGSSIIKAGITKDGFYAGVSYDGLVVRNTDPAQHAEKVLKVYDQTGSAAVRKAYESYSNDHANVSVGISSDYMESSDITESLLTRSCEYDVFIIPCNSNAFTVCLERGYMAELNGNADIKAFFERMYPEIADALCTNGSISAVPLYSYASGFGVNNDALAAAGMTIEDIPTDWVSFINWLPECAAKIEGKGVDLFGSWMTQEYFKQEIFSCVFVDYMKYLNYTGRDQGYNTDILYNALKALEDLDVSGFGLRTEEENDEEAFYEYNENSMTLFESYTEQLASGGYYGYTPLAISVSEDTPFIIELEMYAAFVNPFSANREEAIEFLAYIVDNLDEAQISDLDPEANEPIRSSSYEEQKQYAEEQIESAEKYLETCAAAEKQDAELILEENKKWLEEIEEDYWEVNPKQIEWYRAHDDHLSISSYEPLYYDNDGEIYEYMEKYLSGMIDLRTMLEGIDKKVHMMYLEGN